MSYAKAIRVCRAAKGWSQQHLAEALGSSPAHVSLLEADKRTLTRDMEERLVGIFGIDPLAFHALATGDTRVAPEVALSLLRWLTDSGEE